MSGGDVTITAAGRISANNFLPGSAFVNMQGTDIALTSGTDATLGAQRFIALGFGAGRGNLTATSGPININAGTSFGGCFAECYQGDVLANASDITINAGTFFATSGDVRAPAGNITINTGPTGLFIGDFANSRSSQVKAGMNLTVNAGQITLQGGSGAGTFAELRGGPGLVNITTTAGPGSTGNVIINGGSGMNAFARIFGDPDVNMTVGGAIAMNAGTGAGAFARVESASAASIEVTFPNLTSGGYMVNSAPVTSSGSSGFFAGGSPATLGENLIVTYCGSGTCTGGATSPPPELEPPPDINNPVIAALNQQVDVLADQMASVETAQSPAPEEEKKKQLPPICGK